MFAGKQTNGHDARVAALLQRHAQAIQSGNYAAAREALAEIVASETSGTVGFRVLSRAELCAPLEPVSYVIEHLDICPGRPTQITGMGFAGKTIAAQSMLTSIMAGRPVWGALPCLSGPCAHLDFEMGQRATLQRYRRLAAGQGVSFENDVAPRLSLACLPSVYLNSPEALDHLRRLAEGKSVVLVDSLRRAIPGVNENDSIITAHIDILTKVSVDTGATFVFLHHSTTKSYGDQGDQRGAGRGSSAIFDCSGAVLSLTGAKGDPVRVSQTKAAERGTPAEDFFLSIDDVEVAGDPRGGVAVAYKTLEQVKASGMGRGRGRSEEAVDRIVEAIAREGKRGVAGADAAARLAGMKAERARTALRTARSRGLVLNVAFQKDGRLNDRQPKFVATCSSRPLKGTGRAEDSSGDEGDERDEGDEGDERDEGGGSG